MVWLYLSIVQMLQEIVPNFIRDTKLLSQYDHSIELLVNHMADLCINGVGSEIDRII